MVEKTHSRILLHRQSWSTTDYARRPRWHEVSHRGNARSRDLNWQWNESPFRSRRVGAACWSVWCLIRSAESDGSPAVAIGTWSPPLGLRPPRNDPHGRSPRTSWTDQTRWTRRMCASRRHVCCLWWRRVTGTACGEVGGDNPTTLWWGTQHGVDDDAKRHSQVIKYTKWGWSGVDGGPITETYRLSEQFPQKLRSYSMLLRWPKEEIENQYY